MKKFKVYLEYDPEYEGFVADAPNLPGCMSQGKTEEEALKKIAHEKMEQHWKDKRKSILITLLNF